MRREDQKQYDRTVAGDYPGQMIFGGRKYGKKYDLKYARNPHCTGAFFAEEGASGASVGTAEIVKSSKDPGFINIEDMNMAIRIVRKLEEVFRKPCSAVIKHEIPCGAAVGSSIKEAFENAWKGDPLSAFGGVIALSGVVDGETATSLTSGKFTEWVVAPGYDEEAMGIFEDKNVRLMKIEPFGKKFLGDPFEYKKLDGGVLVGEPWNSRIVSPEFVEVRAGSPTEDDVRAAMLQWLICGFTKSNAVVVGDSSRAFGIGSGQTSRIDAAFMALYKATARGKYPDGAKGLVAASDAFWPFPDGAEMLGKAGVKGCMYPLGSNKDQEVIDAFSEQGMFVLTPRPHPDRPTDIERAFY